MPEIYSKKDHPSKIEPNLLDYTTAYKAFSYEDAAKNELEWFDDGTLNAAYSAVDKHLSTAVKDKIALLWEGSEGHKETYTYSQLAMLSNQIGNLLKSKGISRGDRVFIFLPRVPLLFISFLGILKI